MPTKRKLSDSSTRASSTYLSSRSYLGDNSTTSPSPSNARNSVRGPKSRTKTATSTGATYDQQIICALTESRGVSPTVGLAFVNISTTEAVLCQIVDNQTYVKTLHKLHVFEPTEILIPHTTVAPLKSKLVQILEANLAIEAPITPISRKHWDETIGLEYIHSLAFKEDVEAIKVSIGGNYFATCCFAAALTYVDHSLAITFAFHTMRIKYEASDGSMMMDLSTINSLELIQNSQSARSKQCLLGLLDHTLTPMGCRVLRSNILQPLTGKQTIEKRYDALQELTTNDEMFVATRQALKLFIDVDRVLTDIVLLPRRQSVQYWQQSINNVILVKQYVKSIPVVYEALEGCRSELLKGIRGFCAPDVLGGANKLIDDALNEDVTYQKKPGELRNQRTYAIKAGVNGLLDVARQTYKEANQDVFELLGKLQDEYEINMSLKYDAARQFYFTFPASDLEERPVPEIFVNLFRKRSIIECQTLSLVKLNQKIVDSHHEVLQMSDDTVQTLIEGIRGEIAPLFKVSESIALLDMLASFAHVTTCQGYTRPEISSTLAIQAARHPIRDKFQTEKFVANDVYAPSTKRLQIITGCNMSGKSTYIRSIALLTIMAQIGCFLPVQYASITIRSQLFTRVSVDDSSMSHISTFAAEMRETAFILRNVDARSMVIIDELGRGTSTRDGLAIAIAVAEALVQSKALVWFVTHFHDLPVVLSERPGVTNFHMKSRLEDSNCMTMLYEIGSGPVEESHYGLALAKVAGLPEELLKVAEAASFKLEALRQKKRQTSKTVIQARKRRLILGLKEQLIQAKESTMEGEILRLWLKNLQEEFIMLMSKLDNEEQDAERITCDNESESSESTLVDTSGTVDHESKNAEADDEASYESPTPQQTSIDEVSSVVDRRSPSRSCVYSSSNCQKEDGSLYKMSGAV